MPREMLNDAKWHLQQAELYTAKGESAIFALWHEVRATAVFALASVESLINQVAYKYLQDHSSLDMATKEYLAEEHKGHRRYVSLDDKLGEWTEIITGKIFDKSDQVWRDFQEIKNFRDALIHYKPSRQSDVYSTGTIEMARQAVKSAQAIIERFYDCWGEPLPPWVTALYQEIK